MSLLTCTPGQVLAAHAELAARHSNPGWYLTGYWHNYMTDVARKHGYYGMSSLFYPVIGDDPQPITRDHAEDVARVVGSDLAWATTYQVTSEMIDVMRSVYHQVEHTETLDRAEVPCESGFAWFDESWPIRDVSADIYDVRAISWRFLTANVRKNPAYATPDGTWPAARICLWVHIHDDPPDKVTDVSRVIGELQAIHTAVIPFGIPFRVPEDQSQAESFLGLVHLLWMFLGMEITATNRPKIKNHYRKHALKSLKHGEVHVVLLRRVRYTTDPPDFHRHVDWQARWVVQGHWRHLSNPNARPGTVVHRAVAIGDTCSVCGGKLTWVRPYIKGPDGLPLKVSQTLMRLAR